MDTSSQFLTLSWEFGKAEIRWELYVKVESTCTKVGSSSKIWSIQTVPFIFLFEVLGFLRR